jgi:hypothetical protein
MTSPQAIGKMITKLHDIYCDERNRLYQEYDLNYTRLFTKYVMDRKRICGHYIERVERFERHHAEKCCPLDYSFQASIESIDKDIAIPHAPAFSDFEEGRSNADGDFVTELGRLYWGYREQRLELDRIYQAARVETYKRYKAQRDELENEGRGEPANNS